MPFNSFVHAHATGCFKVAPCIAVAVYVHFCKVLCCPPSRPLSKQLAYLPPTRCARRSCVAIFILRKLALLDVSALLLSSPVLILVISIAI